MAAANVPAFSAAQHNSLPSPGTAPTANAAPNSQTPGHPSFRRQRASRACETCHARKVRCDAASLGVPCTNCVAFSIECKIPTPKRKKTSTKNKDSDSELGESVHDDGYAPAAMSGSPTTGEPRRLDVTLPFEGGIQIKESDGAQSPPPGQTGSFAQIMKPKFVRAPIKEAGRVAYLGESSNLSLLVHDRYGSTDVVHYPLPEAIRGARNKMNELDQVEIDILHQRGAFLLPPRALCDELVEAFFKWVSPVVPVINRSRFMRRYRDSKNPPSLLLLQAVLLAGSRVCNNPQLMDANGSTTPAAMTFYKRAKSLFDANYEDDRVTIVQAVILMGWYWEGPEDVTKNVFYWTRVAIAVAQGSGMHRSVESSQLSRADKRLWKRIWWTLFTRDRSVAVALGRPVMINIEDSDIEMVTEDDFVDDEADRIAEFPSEMVHVHFFLNYVKLCEIMGLVLAQQYSVASRVRKHAALDLTHSDVALGDWLQNCPKEVYWERPRHHFWAALLHVNYYTTLCLLHRAHMPPAGTPNTIVQDGLMIETTYPSRNIAYQAAAMITSIIESLQANDELKYTPAFIVYSLFSALIMHVYQMRSSNQSVVSATEQRMQVCMTALKDVSKVWLVARMVHTLFESIIGNKVLEERLQKAAGKRHSKKHGKGASDTQKRKYDDTDFSSNGPPPAQVSYERSRPQTPALTPSRELSGQGQGGRHSSSPRLNLNNGFPGNSHGNTQPGSPSNHQSHAVSPPDLFLATRNSPTIAADVWNKFQPDQLFPADTNLSFANQPTFSPNSTRPEYLDPQLAGHSQQMPSLMPNSNLPSQQQRAPQMAKMVNRGSQNGQMAIQQQGMSQQMPQMQQHQNDPTGWAHLGVMNPQPGQDDTWSNSSISGPIVPTTLNVEDWFQFFGINGDLNAMSSF